MPPVGSVVLLDPELLVLELTMPAMLREHKNRGNLLRYQKFQET